MMRILLVILSLSLLLIPVLSHSSLIQYYSAVAQSRVSGGNYPTFVASAVLASAPTTTYVVNKPTGTAEGDLIFIDANADVWNSAYTWPTEGFTEIIIGGSDSTVHGMAYRVAGASEPTTYTVTNSQSSAGLVIITTYRKTSGTWGIDDSSEATSNTVPSDTQITASVTCVANSILHISYDNDGQILIETGGTPPATMTLISEQDVSSIELAAYREEVGAGSYQRTAVWASAADTVAGLAACISAD